VPDGSAADIGLGDLPHFDGGHDARRHPGRLEGVLEGEGVDHSGQHAHVVGRYAVHLLRRGRHARKKFPPPTTTPTWAPV